MHINNGLFILERNIGQLGTVWRPNRRNNRLFGFQRRLRILTIGISNTTDVEIKTGLSEGDLIITN